MSLNDKQRLKLDKCFNHILQYAEKIEDLRKRTEAIHKLSVLKITMETHGDIVTDEDITSVCKLVSSLKKAKEDTTRLREIIRVGKGVKSLCQRIIKEYNNSVSSKVVDELNNFGVETSESKNK